MFWVILTLLAVILLAGAILIDKFVITKEIKDPYLASVISGSVIFIVFILISPLFPRDSIPLETILVSLAAGAVYITVLWFYFFTLSKEEVSRAVPVFSAAPLFVLPFGFFLFGEVFSTLKYVGIVSIVLGAFLISLKKSAHRIKFDRWILLGVFTAFLFGLRSVLIKLATLRASIWSVMPWIGLGGLISSGVVFAFHHPHIIRKAKGGVEHLLLTGLFTSFGISMLFVAISIGPVSLVTALASIRPFLVSIFALILSFLYPEFIEEHLTTGIIIQKMVATFLVVAGSVLVAF